MIPPHIEDLLDHGYSVIPSQGKVPCVKWSQYQSSKPGYEQTEAWAKQFPGCTWALLLGQYHNLVVVDADSAEACGYVEAIALPTPMRVRSRRGMHFYYRHPGYKVQSKRYLDDPEVDVKGDGGLCTALGCTRADSFAYTLDDGADLVSIRNLPYYDKQWFPLPELAIPAPVDLSKFTGLDRFDRATRWIEKAEPASSGNRNEKAIRVAYGCVRGFGLSQDEGLGLMRLWNERNSPPLDDAELKAVVQSAMRSGRQSVGAKCALF